MVQWLSKLFSFVSGLLDPNCETCSKGKLIYKGSVQGDGRKLRMFKCTYCEKIWYT